MLRLQEMPPRYWPSLEGVIWKPESLTFRRSEWWRAAPVCGFGRLVSAAIWGSEQSFFTTWPFLVVTLQQGIDVRGRSHT